MSKEKNPKQETKVEFSPTDAPLILNWVYRHMRPDEGEVTLSKKANAAHTVAKTEKGDKISVPACVICATPLIPCVELPEGEMGIIEACPQLPQVLGQIKHLQEAAAKKYPRNMACPCGSEKKYKNCCGKPEIVQ